MRGRTTSGAATLLAIAAACWLGPLSSVCPSRRAGIHTGRPGWLRSRTPPSAPTCSRSKPQAGASFTVHDQSSTVVLSGSVGPALGRWSCRAGEVYPVDFDSLTTPGTYTIELAGKTPATSPAFAVAPAAPLYGAPLANALSFYENERDGPEVHPLGAAARRPPT